MKTQHNNNTQNNFKLFFYSIKADLFKFYALVSFAFGALIFFSFSWIIGTILMIAAFPLLTYGHAMGFDFKRQSGLIVYRGA